MLAALFIAPTGQPELCKRAKRHRSYRTTDGENVCARKKEHNNFEVTRRASLIDEDTRQRRARELAGGRMLRGAPLRVHRLMWAPLKVSLLQRLLL